MKQQNKKKTVCIIPARYASTRLPGKPLIEVNGLPLIMWAYKRAAESEAFGDIYVATDDSRIKDTVEQYKGKAIMTSPDHTSGTDRVFEVVQNTDCDYIVNLQGDEPRIPVDILQDFAENVKKIDKMSLLTCVSYATIKDADNPNVVKVVLTAKGDAIYFSRSRIPFDRDKQGCRIYKHSGIYGFSRESLTMFCSLKRGYLEEVEKLEQLRALENGMKIHCLIKDYKSINIDTPEDLEHFRSIINGS